ncbi:unnamed protein product, partial [Phaeothamnion confervicola]
FAEGIFDREAIAVAYGDVAYRMVPVVGLPQYDGPDQASLMVMDALSGVLADLPDDPRTLVVRPGVGHLPMAVRARWPGASVVLLDRDLLAVRASERALGDGAAVATFAATDFAGVKTGEPFDLAIAMIPDQMRPPVMARLLEDLLGRLVPAGTLLVGGDSTEVSRFL